MATSLWGKVYFTQVSASKAEEILAGRLQQEPGERYVFTYDADYLKAGYPAIAHSLPLQAESHISEYGLYPFFDNLVAEDWYRDV